MEPVARWWDGVELWVTGLPFVPQAIVVLLVLVPTAFLLARVFDRLLAVVLRLLGRDARAAREAESTAGAPTTTKDGQ
ncbi:hypothetical protein ACIGGF_01530 [Rhodococcus sp. NPDC078407]|uniref:hypothetical protein n=1 Tax=Rhodococcus sp. NPDC078407 TaxID=3364509 RepID=UPI0037C82A99